MSTLIDDAKKALNKVPEAVRKGLENGDNLATVNNYRMGNGGGLIDSIAGMFSGEMGDEIAKYARNRTITSTLVGAGVGGVGGAVFGDDDENGALKGALVGAAAGGAYGAYSTRRSIFNASKAINARDRLSSMKNITHATQDATSGALIYGAGQAEGGVFTGNTYTMDRQNSRIIQKRLKNASTDKIEKLGGELVGMDDIGIHAYSELNQLRDQDVASFIANRRANDTAAIGSAASAAAQAAEEQEG